MPANAAADSSFRTPTLWVLTIVLSGLLSGGLAVLYRNRAVGLLCSHPFGRKVYDLIPIAFSLALMVFCFEAGLYLLMEDESSWWHVVLGLVTYCGGSYYAWWVYAWSLPSPEFLEGLAMERVRNSNICHRRHNCNDHWDSVI